MVVVGHPVLISHRKYARNLLQFNVGFVFNAGASPALLRSFKPVARKLAETLRMLEEVRVYPAPPLAKYLSRVSFVRGSQ